ncbi:MAG: Fic family protein [Deferribacteraceae bacterium]|jgi:Fic family protein|nr:Fic family protein [Deferribacteraceae bacterium]
MSDIKALLEQIDANRAELANYEMPSAARERFDADRRLSVIHSTTVIEGNTLTLQEARQVLEGYSVADKQLRELWEVTNMNKAIDFMEANLRTPLTEEFIKQLNAIVMQNINDTAAGSYRFVNVRIVGASFSPPSPQELRVQMGNLVAQYNSELYLALHPVERAAKLHTDFVRIHPFEDGNGRTARLLMNSELRKHGYPMISINARIEYLKALETYGMSETHEPLVMIITQEVLNEQKLIKEHSLKK